MGDSQSLEGNSHSATHNTPSDLEQCNNQPMIGRRRRSNGTGEGERNSNKTRDRPQEPRRATYMTQSRSTYDYDRT